jgi:RHS repeat-associated protein
MEPASGTWLHRTLTLKVSLVIEEDSSGQLTVSTDYSYDTMGRLITITQGVQTRSFTYDALGRLKTETHPENGTTSYSYDANSNIVTRTDARNVTTTYAYDELNRVTSKTYSDGTPSVTYFYDSQPSGSPITIQNPVGRLTKVSTTASGVTASTYYSYCNCSSVSKESTVITDGTTKTYTTEYTYNYVGGITSIRYPNPDGSGKLVSYTRDEIGRETKVSSTIGGNSIDYIRSASYLGPHGGLTEMEHPIQSPGYFKTEITYSAKTLRMMSLKTFGLYMTYNYNVNEGPSSTQTGHIYGIVDNYNLSNSNHFEYDRWYRLKGYWVSNARTDPYSRKITWTYDQYGNVTSIFKDVDPLNCPTGCTTNFSINPATNRLTNKNYDAAGNTLNEGTYDAENRLTAAGGQTFLYDGNSRRLRKVSGTIKTYFVYSATGLLLVEHKWTGSMTRQNLIYFNGKLVATHDEQDYVRLFFKDHLGSTRSVVKVNPTMPWGANGSWQTIAVYEYEPYGGMYSSYEFEYGPAQKYTGKERDGSGLDYFGARHYNSRPGGPFIFENPRWVSADSVMARPYDPPSLNKYVYCRADPINLIDSDGASWSPWWGEEGGPDPTVFLELISHGRQPPLPADTYQWNLDKFTECVYQSAPEWRDQLSYDEFLGAGLAASNANVAVEFVLAIWSVESNFGFPEYTGREGARGPMQTRFVARADILGTLENYPGLLPAWVTAEEVNNMWSLLVDDSKGKTEEALQAGLRLGALYVAVLIGRYGIGTESLGASYNAGPRRAKNPDARAKQYQQKFEKNLERARNLTFCLTQ